jgi:SagB-type dehydrogenase family enzyme
VKVQGYRIELGEIESAIVQNEYIKEAVVIATGGGGNARELVAYIVPNKNVMPSTDSQKETDGDNVGPLGNTDSTIQNTRERVIFKLERHGIRKFEETLASIKLRRPKQDEKLTINYQNNGPKRFTNKKMKLEEFSSVFDSLMAKQIEELPLPKYYYPSAGSLYPVQTYVCVEPGMIDEIEAGCYYYNPQEHRLELLNTYNRIGKRGMTNDRVNQYSFTLHLISNLNAIRPMYGELSETFSYQEAGYMANLLLTSCRHEIGLDSNIAINEDELSICFNLSSAHLHLQSFTGGKTTNIKGNGAINIPFDIKRIKGKIAVPLTCEENKENEAVQISCIARKSYRIFNGEELVTIKKLSALLDIIVKGSSNIFSQKLLNIYLYVKENKIIGLEKGAYYFDPYKRVLKMINDAEEPISIFNGNESIYNSSGFAIMLTGKKRKEEKNLALYLTGYIGQSIMNISTYHNVGLCAIGSVTHKRLKEILKLSKDEEVLHTFLGGSIKLEQIESVEELSGPVSTQHDPVGLLRRYLEEKIPKYMIPSHFVFLENLPLTSNGKLNRKALPDPEFKVKEDYIEPSNETEERLAKIWSEVLNIDKEIISVNNSFFELGGHSLKATALVNKINLEFGIEMLLKEVFVNETLKEQAELIETSEWLFNKKSNFENSEKFEITI